MKKYFLEADKHQWEKPTEQKYVSCATAKTLVYAESEAEALLLAQEKLEQEYFASGFQVTGLRITKSAELPIDWNYGYGDDRKSGTEADKAAITAANQYR